MGSRHRDRRRKNKKAFRVIIYVFLLCLSVVLGSVLAKILNNYNALQEVSMQTSGTNEVLKKVDSTDINNKNSGGLKLNSSNTNTGNKTVKEENPQGGINLKKFKTAASSISISSEPGKEENSNDNNDPEALKEAASSISTDNDKNDELSQSKNETTSNKIKIVIDPGHGGIDKGTSIGNVVESVITLDISKKLKSYLEKDGYNIVLTRDSDVALDNLSSISGTREDKDLDARTSIINKSQANLFISIHVNSYQESPSTSGSIVFYNDKLPQSIKLAQSIQKELNSITVSSFKRQSHDCEKANYYVLINSDIPGVLVETAFITNTSERELLTTETYKEKIAEAIKSGIEDAKFN